MAKIIADVEQEVKDKLEELAYRSRSNKKAVIVRLIEKAYEEEFNHELSDDQITARKLEDEANEHDEAIVKNTK